MSRGVDAVEAYATGPLVYRGRCKRPPLEAEMIDLDQCQADVDRPTMPEAIEEITRVVAHMADTST